MRLRQGVKRRSGLYVCGNTLDLTCTHPFAPGSQLSARKMNLPERRIAAVGGISSRVSARRRRASASARRTGIGGEMNRRQFVKTGVAGGVGMLVGDRRILEAATLPTLQPFVDPLPVPTHLPHSNFYHITMNQVTAKLHRDLPPTPVWAYSGYFLRT